MTTDLGEIATYDYELPPELIAAEPLDRRDASRLLVVDRSTGRLSHGTVSDLPTLLSPGDLLVLNDTRVVPARLRGVREATGGKWEGLFLRTTDSGAWELLAQTRGRVLEGETVSIRPADRDASPLRLVLTRRSDGGSWIATPDAEGSAFNLLERYGEVPLPPYIRKGIARGEDRERYQTVYARNRGSVAAPTAGLHFTEALLSECERQGIGRTNVTLHVGIGTFRPVAAERLDDHVMHAEWGELSAASAERIRRTRSEAARVVAVGTTSVRVLETAVGGGEIGPFRGDTNLFIRPPYRFRAVDALLTNFHLPRSTLLVLVSALAGFDLIRAAYAEAVRERYRFFSYGDAMLIL